MEFVYGIVGENVWRAFFADETVQAQNALPTQLHAVIAHQARLAMNRIMKGKGKAKGKADLANGQY